MNDTVNVKGLSELAKFLDTLPDKLQRNVMRGAMRAGARVALPVAKSNIASISGQLAASLKAGSAARGGVVTGYVRTRYFTAKWVEYGTRRHTIKAANGKAIAFAGGVYQSVEHPGARPKPFLRPALESQAGAAVVAVGEYMKTRLATKHGLDTADITIEVEE